MKIFSQNSLHLPALIAAMLFIASTPAYAFSSILLMDPSFQRFLFIYIPIISSILMTLWEAVALNNLSGRITKKLKNVKFFSIFKTMLMANIWAFVICLATGIFVTIVVWNSGIDPRQPAVLTIAFLYFAAVFFYIAWYVKCKKLSKLLGHNARHSPVRSTIFMINLVSYGVLYGYLYWRMF